MKLITKISMGIDLVSKLGLYLRSEEKLCVSLGPGKKMWVGLGLGKKTDPTIPLIYMGRVCYVLKDVKQKKNSHGCFFLKEQPSFVVDGEIRMKQANTTKWVHCTIVGSNDNVMVETANTEENVRVAPETINPVVDPTHPTPAIDYNKQVTFEPRDGVEFRTEWMV